jgi:hypothetical protein
MPNTTADTPDFDLFAPEIDAVTTRSWVAVACAAHVRLGHAGGYMQVCHGRAAPLRHIRPGDRVVYYSPTDRMGDGVPLRAFTAIGTVRDREPYVHDMGNGFRPFRRDVAWCQSHDVPIKPLLQTLDFTSGVRNWGHQLRFGLFDISSRDLDIIAIAMGAGPELLKSFRPAYWLSGSRPVDLSAQNHHL